MKIGIIHFSDIHTVQGEQNNPVLKKKDKIIDHVKNKIIDYDKVFIVVTGDFAFSGNPSEFELIEFFLFEIQECLQNYSGKKIEIIGIPGNHDCSFSGSQKVRNLVIKDLEDSSFEKIDSESIEHTTEVLKNYFDFENRFLNQNAEILHSDNLMKIIRYDFGNEFSIIFNCLNSAWISKLKEKEGQMAFPINYFEPDIFENKASIKINLIHHPINWQNSGHFRKIRSFLSNIGCLTLSGHEHTNEWLKSQGSTTATHYFLESGALQETGNNNSNFNLLTINLEKSSIILENYNYSSGSFNQISESGEQMIPIESLSSSHIFNLDLKYEEFLDSLSAPFIHRRKENLVLDDLYIDPLLKLESQDSDDFPTIELSKVLTSSEINKMIFIGEETSGKTTICKKLVRQYRENGMIPLIVRGREIEQSNWNYIFNTLLRDSFERQYHSAHHSKFDKIDKSKVAVIIDNFHACELKDEYRNGFISTLDKQFKTICFTSNQRLFFNPLVDGDFSFDEYMVFEILELSFNQRFNLIQKWNGLNNDVLNGNDLHRKCEDHDRLVKQFLGKDLLPSYPMVIISALQSIDTGATEQSTFQYYYKFIIEEALKNNIQNKDELQFYTFFLAEFCHFLFSEKLKNIGSENFDEFFEQYLIKIGARLNASKGKTYLLNAKIIKQNGDFIKIAYPYIYYYFTALYFSQNLERQSKLKEKVKHMVERLYIDEYSNVILFLTQLTSSPFVIETLYGYTEEYFKDYQPAKLQEDIVTIDQLAEELPRLSLNIDDIEKTRKENISERSEAEIHEQMLDNEYKSKDYDRDEDIANISLLNRFIRAIKTFEILGQVIKKNWGSYDVEDKQKYILSSFNLSMRVLSAYFSFIKESKDDIADYIYYVADKRNIKDSREIKKLAQKTIFQLAFVSTQGIIKRVANSISHNQLISSIKNVVTANNSNSHKLIEQAIKLDHLGKLDLKEVEQLFKNDREFNKHYLPVQLLRTFIFQYLRLYEVPYEERAKISAITGINIKAQRRLQEGSKQKK